MKKYKIFIPIFFLLMASLPLVHSSDNQESLPSWVRVGSHARYFLDFGVITLKYNNKFYTLASSFGYGGLNSTGYLYWEITKVNDVEITIHMKINIYYLGTNVTQDMYGKLHLHKTNIPGFVNYSDEKTFRVNFIKRELISNGGYVNLWINPAMDVTWDKSNVSSVQKDSRAKPIAKYLGTEFTPKVMVFPSNIKNDKLHLYDPYIMEYEVSDEDKEILEKNDRNMTLPNNLTPITTMPTYYDRDTGILLYGSYTDDVLFTQFHNYGDILCAIDFNNTNIIEQKGKMNSGILLSWEQMVTIIIVAGMGVAVWILWKRRK